jgi:peptidoglycan/LPS O-acetylase OafA/YrhL
VSIILLKRNRAPTLSSEFDSRRNNLTPLRLGLAVAVLVTHGQSNGFGWQVHLGRTELGQVALDSFFVISGLLVTRSYLALGSFARFAWHRFLRIMPGFWVCLLVTALVFAPIAALVERGSAGAAFSGDRSALHYVVNNAGLLMRQYDIAGLLSTVPNPEVFNGSLWTLVFEAVCYALLGLVGLCGILQRRRWVVGVGVVVLWGLLLVTELGLLPLPGTTLAPLLRFAFVFALGSAAWLYAERLPISGELAVGALGTVVLALLTTDHSYLLLGGVGLAYLLVWVTVRAPLPWRPRADLSYGVYVYHWPVQQLLALVGLSALGPTPTVLLGLVGAATCALASWHLVERPALRQKDARWVRLLERGQVAEPARP